MGAAMLSQRRTKLSVDRQLSVRVALGFLLVTDGQTVAVGKVLSRARARPCAHYPAITVCLSVGLKRERLRRRAVAQLRVSQWQGYCQAGCQGSVRALDSGLHGAMRPGGDGMVEQRLAGQVPDTWPASCEARKSGIPDTSDRYSLNGVFTRLRLRAREANEFPLQLSGAGRGVVKSRPGRALPDRRPSHSQIFNSAGSNFRTPGQVCLSGRGATQAAAPGAARRHSRRGPGIADALRGLPGRSREGVKGVFRVARGWCRCAPESGHYPSLISPRRIAGRA